MIYCRYFFLHISLFILFLTFPLSSAHKWPKNPVTPPTNTDNPAPPCTCTCNNSGTPPSDTDTPTTPPGNTNSPSSPPPGNTNSPSSPPPGDTKAPTTPPPGDTKTPTTPPSSDTETPTTPPPSDTETPTTPPPSDTKTPTTPPSDDNSPSTPPSNNNDSYISYKNCFSKVFAFGDSYTDTGNAQLAGGLKSFVGTLISHFGSKLPGYRQSNGRLMVDFLCENLGLPYLPPFKKSSSNFSGGANFAVGGSTALASEFFNKHIMNHPLMWKGTPLGFQVQVDWFQKFMQEMECKGKDEDACRSEIGDALFWIGDMGGNDYARILGSSGSPFSMRSLAETAVGQVTKLLTQLLEKGAKYIVVQGVPPIGCCPLQLILSKQSERDSNGCSSIANAVIKSHNELLQKSLLELQKRFTGCTILYADVWGAYHHILANYKKFKFSEPFKACCGVGGGPFNFKLHSLCGSLGTSTCQDPSTYISWDGIHFTEAMYRQLAQLILRGGFTSPMSFQQLIKLKLGVTTKATMGSTGASGSGFGFSETTGASGSGSGSGFGFSGTTGASGAGFAGYRIP